MAYCSNCGTNLPYGARFCPSCGKASAFPGAVGQQPGYTAEKVYDEAADLAENKVFSVFAYFGLLILIPVFAAKGSRFARYHINQGLVMLISGVAVAVGIGLLSAIFLSISVWLYSLIAVLWAAWWVALVVLAILGVVNAASGRTKPLPVIGGLNILK